MALNYEITSPVKINAGLGQAEIQINNASNTLSLKPPTSLSSSYDFVFPDTSGTNGQILAKNNTGGTVWQNNSPMSIDNFSALATTTYTNTNTGTPVVVNNMSLTPSAGSYICFFNSSCSISPSDTLNYGIYVNGSLQTSSERSLRDGAPFFSSGFLLSMTTLCEITVNGTDVVDVRALLLSSGSYSIFERLFFLLKIG